MVYNGVELVEEGAGFGVPIVKYADKTFFACEAVVYLDYYDLNSVVLRKVFNLNAVSEKQLNGLLINNSIYHNLHKIFTTTYLTQKKLNPIFNQIMALRKTLGIKTRFIKTASRGIISVTYLLEADRIKVKVDLNHVEREKCQEILLLNEQGASFFVKFQDGTSSLDDVKVGGWSKVASGQGCFSTADRGLSFFVDQHRNARLFFGREKVRDRFAWAGMTYALHPQTVNFSYQIHMQSGNSNIQKEMNSI